MNRSSEWDAISFDREDGYYDLWALSYHPYIYSFFHFRNSENAVKKLKSDFTGRMQHHRKIAPDALIPVYSAFNGFAIYKTSVFLESHYSSSIDLSLFPKGAVGNHAKFIGQKIVDVFEGDCEHRSFHLRAIQQKGARIRISLLSLFEGKP